MKLLIVDLLVLYWLLVDVIDFFFLFGISQNCIVNCSCPRLLFFKTNF